MTDTKLQERYLDGFSLGVEMAERMIEDRAGGGFINDLEAEYREEAHTAVDIAHTPEGRRMAAWCLGLVRGFRDVVR